MRSLSWSGVKTRTKKFNFENGACEQERMRWWKRAKKGASRNIKKEIQSKRKKEGSGCGSVGRAVASWYQRSPFQIQSSAKIYLFWTFVYCQLCIEKTKMKKKRPGTAHFYKERKRAKERKRQAKQLSGQRRHFESQFYRRKWEGKNNYKECDIMKRNTKSVL